jgi:hypothetical protein
MIARGDEVEEIVYSHVLRELIEMLGESNQRWESVYTLKILASLP